MFRFVFCQLFFCPKYPYLHPVILSNSAKIKPHFFFIFFLFNFQITASTQNQIPPLGQWREHLNYQNAIQVLKADQIYCATLSGLFSIDSNNEYERYSKVSGLNDIGVQCLGWDNITQQLVIAYNNSNLDVLKKNTVKNIGDIKRTGVSGNKTIYQIYCKDGIAYLSTGLGIIVVNLSKYEIKDTWYIGNNGTQIKTNGFVSDGSLFYAATDEGLKSISITNPTISNYANWQNLSGQNGLSPGATTNIIVANNKVIAQKNDSLYILNSNNWALLYADANWPIINISSSENKVLICQRTPSGNARVIILNTTGNIEKTISQSGIISYPRSALLENGVPWIADQFGGLSKFGTAIDRFIPNGPPGTASGDMVFQKNTLFVAAGTVNSAWNYQYNRDGVFDYTQDLWIYKNANNLPILDSVYDFISLAVDPINESLWAGSYGGGLVNFKDAATPIIYKKNNSSLQPAIGDPTSYRVSGLAFDQKKQLWISNYGAAQNLHVRKTDNTWKAISIPFTHIENAVSQILVDDNNQLWIVSPKDNGLFCYNYGQSVDNIADDKWKFYKQGSGNGNLPTNNVLCLAKDKNGFIWVGTDKGIGIIQCGSEVFSSQSCEATLPIIQQDRFAGLLFRDEMVQTIAVDGANRKWIGTKNGVWLISPEGNKIIYRFTEENSPLLNNDIKRIAIDPVTGEVFISTFKGICSFRSSATEGGAINENVIVFPNPVPPGFNGTIAIRGLVDNALVKITELTGRLVFQTRALGGQAVWNGLNYNGTKIASGVYLVIIRDDSGTEKLVTKIVITSGR
jgi:hypothetical protein